jgi:CBS domain containing-hemolysin-like protein
MTSIATEVVLIACLLLLNGVLAMSEIAIVSARKARLRQQAESGDQGAAAALALADEPTRFLSTVQVGITRSAGPDTYSGRPIRVARASLRGTGTWTGPVWTSCLRWVEPLPEDRNRDTTSEGAA